MKSKAPPGHGHKPASHNHSPAHHSHSQSMDQVKIKRIKRNKKPPTTKEKILAGVGVGGALMGGIGAVNAKPSQTEFVREQNQQQSQGASKIKSLLKGIFGIQSAQAAGTTIDISDNPDTSPITTISADNTSQPIDFGVINPGVVGSGQNVNIVDTGTVTPVTNASSFSSTLTSSQTSGNTTGAGATGDAEVENTTDAAATGTSTEQEVENMNDAAAAGTTGEQEVENFTDAASGNKAATSSLSSGSSTEQEVENFTDVAGTGSTSTAGQGSLAATTEQEVENFTDAAATTSGGGSSIAKTSNVAQTASLAGSGAAATVPTLTLSSTGLSMRVGDQVAVTVLAGSSVATLDQYTAISSNNAVIVVGGGGGSIIVSAVGQGSAAVTVHPTAAGSSTAYDQVISVSVAAATVTSGGGGGGGTGNIGYGLPGNYDWVMSHPQNQVATTQGLQMPTGLQMPAGYSASGGGQGLQMPTDQGNVAGTTTSGIMTTYKVKKGDTLWAISKKYYGDGRQWRTILEANLDKVQNPRKMRIGITLNIPNVPSLAAMTAQTQGLTLAKTSSVKTANLKTTKKISTVKTATAQTANTTRVAQTQSLGGTSGNSNAGSASNLQVENFTDNAAVQNGAANVNPRGTVQVGGLPGQGTGQVQTYGSFSQTLSGTGQTQQPASSLTSQGGPTGGQTTVTTDPNTGQQHFTAGAGGMSIDTSDY